ncbi:MAG: regulatory protein RecX [Rikenellaceae bacterium]
MRTKRVRDPYAPPKPKSADQALNSLMRLCARSEKSTGDARRLMSRWGVEPSEQEAVLAQLMQHKFIDDERYATAFIREKSRLNGWGERKIVMELKRKGVAMEIIEERMEALDEGDEEQTRIRLNNMIAKKLRTIKYKDTKQLREKLFRYGASLGYSFSQLYSAIEEATSNINDKEEEDNETDYEEPHDTIYLGGNNTANE